MNAIVQSPTKPVDITVCDALDETAKDYLAHVRFAVAVGVLEKNDFRRCRDENPAVPWCNRSWETQSFGEECAAINLSIAVAIFQQPDGAARFMLRPNAERIV